MTNYIFVVRPKKKRKLHICVSRAKLIGDPDVPAAQYVHASNANIYYKITHDTCITKNFTVGIELNADICLFLFTK